MVKTIRNLENGMPITKLRRQTLSNSKFDLIIKTLIQKDLVVVEQSEYDKRSRVVLLTEKGFMIKFLDYYIVELLK